MMVIIVITTIIIIITTIIIKTEMLQKIALLGTGKIIRRVMTM